MNNPATYLTESLKESQRLAVATVGKWVRNSASPIERKNFQNLLVGLISSERRDGRRRTTIADMNTVVGEASKQANPAAWMRRIIELRKHEFKDVGGVKGATIQQAAIANIPALNQEMQAREVELARRRAIVVPKEVATVS